MLARASPSLPIAVVVTILLVASGAHAFQCLSDSGKAVDWWIAFKYPNPDGRAYSYTDAAASGSSYALARSSHSFSTGQASALNYTLSQLYSKTANSLSFVLYNDDPPAAAKRDNDNDGNGDGSDAFEPASPFRRQVAAAQKAHAKGVIAFDNSGNGFWLVHSVPKFPVSPMSSAKFQYMDDSQVKYAQSFLCVSFSGWATWNTIGTQMQYFRPQFYPSQMSTTGQQNAANLYQALDFVRCCRHAPCALHHASGTTAMWTVTNIIDLRYTTGQVRQLRRHQRGRHPLDRRHDVQVVRQDWLLWNRIRRVGSTHCAHAGRIDGRRDLAAGLGYTAAVQLHRQVPGRERAIRYHGRHHVEVHGRPLQMGHRCTDLERVVVHR